MEATQQLKAAPTTSENIDPASDADQYGLIWGYHFAPNQPPRSITSEEAVEFLTASGPGVPDEFLWLHFSISHSDSEPWLRRYLNLPDTFYECLRSDIDSTHLVQDGDSLVAHIHDVLLDFTFDVSAVIAAILSINLHLIIIQPPRLFMSVDEFREDIITGHERRLT